MEMEKEMSLSAAQLSYVLTLHSLDEKKEGVRSVELAKSLGKSKPSVHNMLLSLDEAGLVEMESRGRVFLTESGRETAELWKGRCEALRERILPQGGVSMQQALCAFFSQLSEKEIREIINSRD